MSRIGQRRFGRRMEMPPDRHRLGWAARPGVSRSGRARLSVGSGAVSTKPRRSSGLRLAVKIVLSIASGAATLPRFGGFGRA